MTDRVHSLSVILADDVRTDDIEALRNAICQFRGVLAVEQHLSDITSKMAEERARHEIRDRISEILWPKRQ
jgi:hypothetical protein